MKKCFFLLFALAYLASCKAPAGATLDTDTANRLAIRNIVDTFSILADTKETDKQTLLFTEDAIVETYRSGQLTTTLTGRKQIGDAFASFLSRFETVYHINGQHSATITGNKAAAITYCLVVLIGTEEGKKVKTTFGIFYNDDFVFEGGRWLISKRKSNFHWTQREVLE